ncbi:MAG: hypothetical protein ACRCVW_00200 [Brevinema sp.]
MKSIILSVILFMLAGCQTSDTLPSYNTPKDVHKIYESQFYMTKNTTENWIEGKWIQTGDVYWSDVFLRSIH